MNKTILASAIGMAMGAAMLATPAQAADMSAPVQATADFAPMSWQGLDGNDDTWDHGRRHRHNHYYGRDDYRGERLYRDTRVWRGNDGRYYCRRKNGTTGLIIGAAGGALLGREIDKYGDRATGTILGAAGGALLGREIDRGGSRCR